MSQPFTRCITASPVHFPVAKETVELLNIELGRTDGSIGVLLSKESVLGEHDFILLFQRLCDILNGCAFEEIRIRCTNSISMLFDAQLQHAGPLRWPLIWRRLAAVTLASQNSGIVQYNLLTVVKMLCQHSLPDLTLALSADSLVKQLLQNKSSHHHQVLELCTELKTLIVVHIPAVQMAEYKQDFRLLWRTLRSHPDGRTRMVAYALLYQSTQTVHHVPGMELYAQLSSGFNDPLEQIRRLCVHLAIYFARTYGSCYIPSSVAGPFLRLNPNTTTTHAEKSRNYVHNQQYNVGENIRLADDAFARICDLVNDVEAGVRLEAITALALISSVASETFIMQTLDKKLMSNMRSKASAHDQRKELFDSGEWTAGRKWATDAPRGDVQAARVSLLPMRACGAFIHALEDDLKSVRSAAVDSILMIARGCPLFGIKSVDFVIDMFNDEIESVRQKAIQALSLLSSFSNASASEEDGSSENWMDDERRPKISRERLRLRPDQLEIVLAVLQEGSRDIRAALLHTVPRLAYSSNECLVLMLNAFLQNLQRNPTDFDAVCESLKAAGIEQHEFVVELFDRLMQIHPYLDTAQPSLDDHNYVATIVLVTNACAINPERLMHRFPRFFPKHYSYMNYRYPQWVPSIPQLSRLQMSDRNRTNDTTKLKREKVLGAEKADELSSGKRMKLEDNVLAVASTKLNTSVFDLGSKIETTADNDSVAVLAHFTRATGELVAGLQAVNTCKKTLKNRLVRKLAEQFDCFMRDAAHIINVGAPRTTGLASFLRLLNHCASQLFKMQHQQQNAITYGLHGEAVGNNNASGVSADLHSVYGDSAELQTVFAGLTTQEQYLLLENHFVLAVYITLRAMHACDYTRHGKDNGGDNFNAESVGEDDAVIKVKAESVDCEMNTLDAEAKINESMDSTAADSRIGLVANLPFFSGALLKLVSFIHANDKPGILQLSALALALTSRTDAELFALPFRKFHRDIVDKHATVHIFCPVAGPLLLRRSAKLTVEQSSAALLRTGTGAPAAADASSTRAATTRVNEFFENLAMHLDVAVELHGFGDKESTDPDRNANSLSGLCVVVDYPDGKRDITYINHTDIVVDALLNTTSSDLTTMLVARSMQNERQRQKRLHSKNALSTGTAVERAEEEVAVMNIRKRIILWHESWSQANYVNIYVGVSSELVELTDSFIGEGYTTKNVRAKEEKLIMPVSSKEAVLVRPRRS